MSNRNVMGKGYTEMGLWCALVRTTEGGASSRKERRRAGKHAGYEENEREHDCAGLSLDLNGKLTFILLTRDQLVMRHNHPLQCTDRLVNHI